MKTAEELWTEHSRECTCGFDRINKARFVHVIGEHDKEIISKIDEMIMEGKNIKSPRDKYKAYGIRALTELKQILEE